MRGEWLVYDDEDPDLPWMQDSPFGWKATVLECTEPFDDEVSALRVVAHGERAVTLEEARAIEVLRCM